MYQFIANDEVIGYSVTPNYVKKLDNGRYGFCSEDEATGVAVNGVPYRLDGKELDDLPVAEVKEIPDSEFFGYVMQSTAALNMLGVQTEGVTTDAE